MRPPRRAVAGSDAVKAWNQFNSQPGLLLLINTVIIIVVVLHGPGLIRVNSQMNTLMLQSPPQVWRGFCRSPVYFSALNPPFHSSYPLGSSHPAVPHSHSWSVSSAYRITFLAPMLLRMVFPGVMYGCESWTIKKAERRIIDAFKLWCWRRLLKAPWTARRSNQSALKEISPEYSLEKTLMLRKTEGRRRGG